MKNLKLNPDKIQHELQQFQTRLQESYSTLKKVKNIDVGCTPHRVIYREDKLQLLHFAAQGDTVLKTPLLISYALVNRWYMIDMEPKRSLIKALTEAGIQVYVIDWGYPDAADRFLDLDDYINVYLNNCVDAVCQHAHTSQTNLLGICQGGTFSLCYSSIYPEKIANLVTMVTPVDFKTPTNLLSLLAQHIDTELAVKAFGNIPGELLNDTYNSLMPMRLGIQKNLGMPNQLSNDESALSFLRMEKWIYDSPDQAGAAFGQFIRWFFQENRLIKDDLSIGEHKVSLQALRMPILNIFGSHDHLVPPDASKALQQYVSSKDYQTLEVRAGHIGVFVSGKAYAQVTQTLIDWFKQRDHTADDQPAA